MFGLEDNCPKMFDSIQSHQMLVNPSNEMREIFRRIYNKETLTGVSSVFGSAGYSSSSGSGGLFGSQPKATTGSIFGGSPSAGIFGNRAPLTAAATSSSIFGGSGSSLFGSGSQPQPQPQQQQPGSSVFGGSGTSVFGSAAPPAFGSSSGQYRDAIWTQVVLLIEKCWVRFVDGPLFEILLIGSAECLKLSLL